MSGSNRKQEYTRLRKQGMTLPEICAATGKSKSTVFYHIRGIPLRESRRVAANKAAGNRMREYAIARTGTSSANRHPIPFDTWDVSTVSLVAHMLFDGRIAKHECVYYNRSKALIAHVRTCMRTVYPYRPAASTTREKVHRIGYYNVELSSLLKNKSIELLGTIYHLDRELQRSFLRAFFDDEGCVSIHASKSRIRGYQHNRAILKLIQHLLRTFSIQSRINKQATEIEIAQKESIVAFREEIGFSSGVFMNHARKNSVHNKVVEKRHLLGLITSNQP